MGKKRLDTLNVEHIYTENCFQVRKSCDNCLFYIFSHTLVVVAVVVVGIHCQIQSLSSRGK